MVTITVDGKKIDAHENALLIDELSANNINIPHFCYHPALGKDGNCRMCMVEIEGKKRPQIACDTPVKDGMVIRTRGENIDRVKRSILELELINHPIDCPICDQAGECSLQEYYMDVGLYDSRLETPKVHNKKHKDLGANVVLDQERCVLCTRCVRFTKKITKTNELGVFSRADHSAIDIYPGYPLSNPYAMNVIDLCPVGALTSKDFRFHKRVWFLSSDKGICNGCAKGCNIFIDHDKAKYEEDIIYRYRPRFNPKVNGYFMCDHGRLSYKQENLNAQSVAHIRGKQSEYEYAMTKVLRLLKHHYGKVLFCVSPSLSLEQMFVIKQMSYRYDAHLHTIFKEEDTEFADDFLKVGQKDINQNSIKLLGIDDSKENLANKVQESNLIVYFGDIACDEEMIAEKACISICAKEPANKERFDVYLPMLTHTMNDGTYINCDGYVQFHKTKMQNSKETKSLLELCSFFTEESYLTCKRVWESGLSELMGDIKFEQIQREAMKMDIL